MTRARTVPGEKALYWTGSSKEDLLAFPEPVIDEIGTALSVAQFGGKHPSAKPWRGEGPGVFEVVEDHRGDTYRAACPGSLEVVAKYPHPLAMERSHESPLSRENCFCYAALHASRCYSASCMRPQRRELVEA